MVNPPAQEYISPEQEFSKILEQHGLVLDLGHPIMDDKWHRLPVAGDKAGAKSGSCIAHMDGVPCGSVKNFKTGQETNWTASQKAVIPSGLDIDRAKAVQVAKQKAEYNQSASIAKLVLSVAPPATKHDYLDKKGVQAHNLYLVPDKNAVNLDNTHLAIANDWREAKQMRQDFKDAGIDKQVLTKGDLIVPAVNERGDICTFQTISGSFKSFIKGAEKSGSFAVLGQIQNGHDVLIAEGYATAATLHEQTDKIVVVAFDVGNLQAVAPKIRQLTPESQIYIAADNDHNSHMNVGIETATKVAQAIDAEIIAPKFELGEKASDWNDLHQSNPNEFTRQIQTGAMGRNDFQKKLSGLSDEYKKVFIGWYDYINKTLEAYPYERNIKQQSLEQEVKKAEAGLSNLPSVEEWQAKSLKNHNWYRMGYHEFKSKFLKRVRIMI